MNIEEVPPREETRDERLNRKNRLHAILCFCGLAVVTLQLILLYLLLRNALSPPTGEELIPYNVTMLEPHTGLFPNNNTGKIDLYCHGKFVTSMNSTTNITD